jgi:phospholipase C
MSAHREETAGARFPGTDPHRLTLCKRGFVDHSLYDTTSILRFVTKRFALPTLAGLQARDAALAANRSPPLGDLTGALDFPSQ